MKIIEFGPLIGLVCLLFLVGCNGPKKPDGFPGTVSFSLTVTMGGLPLPEADIVLIPEDNEATYLVGGRTDAKGIANLTTVRGTYRKPGVPIGKFKVTVKKSVEVPHTKSLEEVYKLGPAEGTAYMRELDEKKKSLKPIVPVKYTTQNTTPLSVTVSSSGTATLDVN